LPFVSLSSSFFSFHSFTNIFVGDMHVPCCLFWTFDSSLVCADRALSRSTSVCLFGWFFFYISFFLCVCSFFSKINKKEENKLERSIYNCETRVSLSLSANVRLCVYVENRNQHRLAKGRVRKYCFFSFLN